MINVKDYGIDFTAVRKAADDALRSKEPLYFPSGIYKLNKRLDLSGSPISIIGDGKGLSRLIWTNASGGIRFVGSGDSANDITTFSISNLTLATAVAGGGHALRIEWPKLTANPIKKTRIHDVEIRGLEHGVHGWHKGIYITNPAGLDISHTDILGKPGITQQGITCTSDDDAAQIRHFLSNLYVLWCDFGIDFTGHNEGIYFSNFEIVGCRIGFNQYLGVVCHISNGHTDCRESGLRFERVSQLKLNNIALFHTGNGGEKVNGNMILLDDCSRFSVSNCTLYGFRGDGDITAQNGLWASNCITGLAVGNQFDQILDTGIVFADGSIHCHSVGNRVINCGRRYANLGSPLNSDIEI